LATEACVGFTTAGIVVRHERSCDAHVVLAAEFVPKAVGVIAVATPGRWLVCSYPARPRHPAELTDPRPVEYEHVLCPAGDHEHSLLLDPVELVGIS
jgi:hypothetical protein